MTDAVAMAKAILAGQDYPGPAEDTPENRAMWDRMVAETEEARARGWTVEIPFHTSEVAF